MSCKEYEYTTFTRDDRTNEVTADKWPDEQLFAVESLAHSIDDGIVEIKLSFFTANGQAVYHLYPFMPGVLRGELSYGWTTEKEEQQ